MKIFINYLANYGKLPERRLFMIKVVSFMVVLALAVLTSTAQEGAQLESPNSTAMVAWETDCTSLAGWHDGKETPTMNALVDQFETSVIRVTQDGNDTWGKVAYVVENIDLEETPIIEVKANKVDKNSAFSIAVASRDWSDMITVIKRTSADGIHEGNIKKAVRMAKKPGDWKGPISFNVVVVIEGKGKASYFDSFCIRAEK
jgi:hypothetical protein